MECTIIDVKLEPGYSHRPILTKLKKKQFRKSDISTPRPCTKFAGSAYIKIECTYLALWCSVMPLPPPTRTSPGVPTPRQQQDSTSSSHQLFIRRQIWSSICKKFKAVRTQICEAIRCVNFSICTEPVWELRPKPSYSERSCVKHRLQE